MIDSASGISGDSQSAGLPATEAPVETRVLISQSKSIAGKLPRLLEESRADRWVFGLLALAVAAAYFWGIHAYWAPAHPGTDQNGYLVGGKTFLHTWSTGFKPKDSYAFVGRMWVEAENGKFFPKYPLGLSVIFAAAMKIGGAKSGLICTFMVNPSAVALALVGTFLLARLAVGSFAALLAVIIVASSPVTMGLTNNPNSHATALCSITWGMYFLLRWWQTRGIWRAILAGFLLGTAVTIRYTEGLVLLPVMLVALMNMRWRERRSWIEALVLGAAWALPVGALVSYNWFSFHHLTGYDPTNESTGFKWEYFTANWETMLRQLYNMGLFFVLPFALLGLVLMWRWNWRVALVMAAWIVPSLALYTAYYWAPDGLWIGYLRFFLTIMPGLALAAVWALKWMMDLAAREGATVLPKIAVGMVVALGCAVNANSAMPDMENEARTNVGLADAGPRILKACPPGSVVFSQERMLNDLQLIGDYQLYDTQQFNRATVMRSADIDPTRPMGLQPQRQNEMYERFKDKSDGELVAVQNQLMFDALNAGRHVYMIFPQNMANGTNRFLPRKSFVSNVVATFMEPAGPLPQRRQQWRQFNRGAAAPAVADQTNRGMVWEIREVKLSPPPPPVVPKSAPRRQGNLKPTATKPTTAQAK